MSALLGVYLFSLPFEGAGGWMDDVPDWDVCCCSVRPKPLKLSAFSPITLSTSLTSNSTLTLSLPDLAGKENFQFPIHEHTWIWNRTDIGVRRHQRWISRQQKRPEMPADWWSRQNPKVIYHWGPAGKAPVKFMYMCPHAVTHQFANLDQFVCIIYGGGFSSRATPNNWQLYNKCDDIE